MDPAQQAFFDNLANNNLGLVQQMMQSMQVANSQLIQELMTGVMGQRTGSNMVDARGVGKPPSFKGEESKYVEWMAKLDSYIRVTHPKICGWLKQTCNEIEPITMDKVTSMGPDAIEFSAKLQAVLILKH